MLNATNHVVWGAIHGGGSSYGYVRSVPNRPRDFQLSGRISFQLTHCRPEVWGGIAASGISLSCPCSACAR